MWEDESRKKKGQGRRVRKLAGRRVRKEERKGTKMLIREKRTGVIMEEG